MYVGQCRKILHFSEGWPCMKNTLLSRVSQLELENNMLRQQIVKLEKTRPQVIKRVELEMVMDTIYEVTGFDVIDLRNHQRTMDIAIIRQCAIYLLYKYAYMHKSAIAKFFARHHTSVMYSIERVDDWHKYPSSFIIEMTMFAKIEDVIIEKIKKEI